MKIWGSQKFLWRFGIGRTGIGLVTPLFSIVIGFRAHDLFTDQYWSGVKVRFVRNRKRKEGEVFFLRERIIWYKVHELAR